MCNEIRTEYRVNILILDIYTAKTLEKWMQNILFYGNYFSRQSHYSKSMAVNLPYHN